MPHTPFTIPEFEKSSFNCPFCLAFASQYWFSLRRDNTYVDGLKVAFCSHCKMYSVWRDEKMISPNVVTVESPNSDLDEEVQDDYREAADILARSPRGAAALLRLAVQKLCNGQLAAKGSGLNEQVADLVKRGLLPQVRDSLDAVRVIGNEAVHPGALDLKDDAETATGLFRLINLIAEQMISHPKQAAAILARIPACAKAQIAKRDGRVPSK
jgi:hypothetical protein